MRKHALFCLAVGLGIVGSILTSASAQPDGCPAGKPAKTPIQRQVAGHGFTFWYHSTFMEAGAEEWCHERKTTNEGPAVYVNWSDRLGQILDGHMIAGKSGLVRAFSRESGDTDVYSSVIKYGSWEPEYSNPSTVYRSVSEFKAPSPSTSRVLPPIWSGLDAVVLDRASKPQNVSIRVLSGVTSTAPFTIDYAFFTRGPGVFAVGSVAQVRGLRGLSVAWEGKAGMAFLSTQRMVGGEPAKFVLPNVKAVTRQSALLRVFLDGQPLASGIVSGYVPID